MKKIMVMFVILAAAFMVCWGETGATNLPFAAKVNAAAQIGRASVLGMLSGETNASHISRIYRFAIQLTPVNDRAAFRATIPAGALNLYDQLILKVVAGGRAADYNADIIEYYSNSTPLSIGFMRYFKPELATKAQCVDLYETVLKNVPLTEATSEKLSKIKGELLKLKDL